jgi:type I restriction enzyme, S subunit
MSHLDWAAELPSQWETKPLRSAADYVVSNVDKVPSENECPVRLCNYTDVYNNEFITPALDFMHATATEDEIARFGLLVDDVIITKDSESWNDIGVPALVRETSSDLVCGYHLALLRPHRIHGAFLFRSLQAKPVRVQLELAANGVTRFGLPKSAVGAMILPIPPWPEQRTIADYLDRETARLDTLVMAKERVLGLLAEKRRALITRAVTRGLDPRAPLRDCGIPWLGEIPAHWEIWKLGHLALIGNCSTPKRDNPEYWSEGVIPWLNSSVVNQEEVTAAAQFVTAAALRECHSSPVG